MLDKILQLKISPRQLAGRNDTTLSIRSGTNYLDVNHLDFNEGVYDESKNYYPESLSPYHKSEGDRKSHPTD